MQQRVDKVAGFAILVLLLAGAGPVQAQGSDPGTVASSLSGLPAFLAYFCVSLIVVTAYVYIYTRITPHDEFKLIEGNVPGAAVSLGLSLIGFAMPVASAIAIRSTWWTTSSGASSR